MLVQISLKDYTVIDSLTVEFSDGLNIITGETGAGKSIIIDAINILLGDRVSPDIVKTGKKQAMVEALFDINNSNWIVEKLEERGFSANDGQLVIRRLIPIEGRSKVFINGSMATLSVLADLTTNLVDTFSQHEHQSLIKPNNHLKFLDSYSDNISLLEECKSSYYQYLNTDKELERLLVKAKDQFGKGEYLKYQLNELDDASLQKGEEEKLVQEEKILSNVEKISSYLSRSYSAIYESGSSAYDTVKNVSKEIEELGEIDPGLSELNDSVKSIIFELENVSFKLNDYLSRMEFNPERLEEINSRIAEINGIKRKYGGTVKEILGKREKISQELSDLANWDDTVDQLKQQREQLFTKLDSLAKQLSLKRKEASERLMCFFAEESKHLGLKGAVLKVEMQEKPTSPDGIDKISFLFSANPDEVPKPLVKVASGGELSRIMLLLKDILSNKEIGSILIFDEIDSGIGGVTAETIGKKIKGLSENNQVICITHLPQVAKFAKTHFKVSKFVENDRTNVVINRLNDEERIEEIGRMLTGKNITEKTLEAAREMLSKAS